MSEQLVRLINTVYSQCALVMNKEPYKSNTRSRTFMIKLQQLYDSVLVYSSSTRQHSLDFTMSNERTRLLIRQAWSLWIQIPQDIRGELSNISTLMQSLSVGETNLT